MPQRLSMHASRILATAALLAQCWSGSALRSPAGVSVRALGAVRASAQPTPIQPMAATRAAPVVSYVPTPAVRRANLVMSDSRSSSRSLAVAALSIWLGTHLLPLLLQAAPASAAELGAPPSPVSPEDQLYFNLIAFVGGPLTLLGGAFFRIINGREQPDFEQDPIVNFLGGPEVVRAAKQRVRDEGMPALFDPSLFRK